MRAPRWAVMGVAIAGISTTVWNAATPDSKPAPPDNTTTQERQLYRGIEERRRAQERQQMRVGTDGAIAEQRRTAEVRRAADDVAKRIFRRVP